MKKSEAVDLLISLIEYSNDEDRTPRENATRLAKEILEEIEKAGMYPPCRRDGKLDWDPE